MGVANNDNLTGNGPSGFGGVLAGHQVRDASGVSLGGLRSGRLFGFPAASSHSSTDKESFTQQTHPVVNRSQLTRVERKTDCDPERANLAW